VWTKELAATEEGKKGKRSLLTVHSRCYRRCEFLSGVLISSVKTSSVNALPIGKGRVTAHFEESAPYLLRLS
jgi:hypothetical protein